MFLLFANRFSEPDPALNDFTRPLVYPDQEFDAGRLELLEVLDAGVVSHATPLPVAGLPRGHLRQRADRPPGAGRDAHPDAALPHHRCRTASAPSARSRSS